MRVPPAAAATRSFLLLLLLLSLLLPLATPALWGSSSSSTDASSLPSATALAASQVEPVRLDWEGITCELKLKKGGRKNLLTQVRIPFPQPPS